MVRGAENGYEVHDMADPQQVLDKNLCNDFWKIQRECESGKEGL